MAQQRRPRGRVAQFSNEDLDEILKDFKEEIFCDGGLVPSSNEIWEEISTKTGMY
jgi:hypothetical protein